MFDIILHGVERSSCFLTVTVTWKTSEPFAVAECKMLRHFCSERYWGFVVDRPELYHLCFRSHSIITCDCHTCNWMFWSGLPTECRSAVISIPASYTGGRGFRSRPLRPAILIFLVFLSLQANSWVVSCIRLRLLPFHILSNSLCTYHAG
jgi:hypothetical protein